MEKSARRKARPPRSPTESARRGWPRAGCRCRESRRSAANCSETAAPVQRGLGRSPSWRLMNEFGSSPSHEAEPGTSRPERVPALPSAATAPRAIRPAAAREDRMRARKASCAGRHHHDEPTKSLVVTEHAASAERRAAVQRHANACDHGDANHAVCATPARMNATIRKRGTRRERLRRGGHHEIPSRFLPVVKQQYLSAHLLCASAPIATIRPRWCG